MNGERIRGLNEDLNKGLNEDLNEDLNDLNGELAKRYYRLALARAACRDLSAAVTYACYACLLGEEHDNAAKLLFLCLYELGDLHTLQNSFPEWEKSLACDMDVAGIKQEWNRTQDSLEEIGALVQNKKWRRAIRKARALSSPNVRVLNIQGCLYAVMKRYRMAARFFAKALTKDRGNQFASAALMEVIES
ncbi:MAG: hypothetical protein FWG14_12740 [Peptococcaceae bacterium]|nr:hypothetical protein [Peptococcaceae bacterium]